MGSWLEKLINLVWINVSGTSRVIEVLLLAVSVKMEIIDFLLPRIKQRM